MVEVVIDAKNKSIGRVASEVSKLIQGKDLPAYLPHKMSDVKVSVINLSQVKFTGKKLTGKIYYKHTGYVGHLKEERLKEVFQKKPTEVFRRALRGMLPKNKFRDRWLKNVKLSA
ncbi:MAG: 50S ribosomal protein L13 [Parcubacteria group bacterium]|nr:50S ribosomal protein L13 [Parcubacteria group bacterium]